MPNLVATFTDLDFSPLASGDIPAVSYTVENIGTAPAGVFNTTLYLSQDNIVDSSDIFLGRADNALLDAGTQAPLVWASTSLRTQIITGDYHFLLVVDADNAVAESNEGDNILFSGDGPQDPVRVTQGSLGLVTGTDRDDTLFGGPRRDTLDGGLGADLLIGGYANDTYFVGRHDTVIENANEGRDHIVSSVNWSLNDSPHVERLTLTGTAKGGSGNALDNMIIGNAGQNLLSGGDGNDTLRGNEGDDTLSGTSGINRLVGGLGDDSYMIHTPDNVIVEKPGQGTDTVWAFISVALRDYSQHLENLSLRHSGSPLYLELPINGIGNGQNNTITGNTAANHLNGAWGDDTLIGGDGDDTFDDKYGANVLIGGVGDDTYRLYTSTFEIIEQPNEGIDTILSEVTINLRDIGQTVENVTLLGTANLSVTGNGLDNFIQGNDGNNLLLGAGGYDTLVGGAGQDRLRGNGGDATLTGGADADQFAFAGDFKFHLITDFDVTEVGEQLRFSATSIDDYADLVANHLRQSGDDAVIEQGGKGAVTLTNVDINDLTEDHFAFF